jgi:predicted metal-dependent peptidase
MAQIIDSQDFYEVVQELSVFNNVFLTLWKLGKPVFTNEIETACVTFDKEGKELYFYFNPDFWNSINLYNRSFVIAHECLHVILKHGYRALESIPRVANMALDVAVNHSLINNFGFNYDFIDSAQNLCWVSTVFPDKKVDDDKSFEYYYDLMLENNEINGGAESKLILVDDHSGLSSMCDEDFEDLLDKIMDNLDSQDLEELKSHYKENFDRGVPGEPPEPGQLNDVFAARKKASKFWDKVLKSIQKKEVIKLEQQFVFKNRRMQFLDKNFMLPHDYEEIKMKHSVPDIHLYLDCSGSCANLAKVFFDLGSSIDSKKYKVRYFSRTTRVTELFKDKNGNFPAFGIYGSDDFGCIERHIQDELSMGKIKSYPVVIHFTDGYDCSGRIVKPEKPQNWYWMLKGNYRNWIPRDCENIFNIDSIIF